jgi:sortase B
MVKKLRWLLGIVFSAMLLYGGYLMAETLTGYAQSDAVKQEVVCAAVEVVKAPPTMSAVPEEPVIEAEAPAETVPVSVDFDALRAINPDVAGWLYCENTPINYPVVQGSDNVYYLRRLLDGKSNRSGTLFLDWRNRPELTDDQSVIYGHHMRNGSMFACLTGYRKQEYYTAHPVIYLLTPEYNFRLEVFSGYVSDPATEDFVFWFDSGTDRETYLTQAVERSDFTANVEVAAEDRIVTLSTCTYEFENARYLIHAALCPMG